MLDTSITDKTQAILDAFGVRYNKRPRSLGRRATQYVEADANSKSLDAWRQLAPIKALLAVLEPANQSANGRLGDPRIRSPGRLSHKLTIRDGRPKYRSAIHIFALRGTSAA